nr:hypothetical protein Q903MT_gene3107 [Picea sitchensis]
MAGDEELLSSPDAWSSIRTESVLANGTKKFGNSSDMLATVRETGSTSEPP